MKTRYFLTLSMLMLALARCETSGQSKEEQTDLLVSSRNFVFHATRALPSRGSSIDLTTNISYVNFSPDLIESYMPFYGRAYSGVGYANDTGLHFKGQPENFKIDRKKNKYEVTTTVRAGTDYYRLYLTVTPSGSASLSISSNNRESMNYQGEITPPKAGSGRDREQEERR